MQLKVPYIRQKQDYTCGSCSLKMVLSYFGYDVPLHKLMRLAGTTAEQGTNRKGKIRALRRLGFETKASYGNSLKDVERSLAMGVPPIVDYRIGQEPFAHVAVVVGLTRTHVILHDPWYGPNVAISRSDFVRRWYGRHKTQFTRWMLVAYPKR